MLHEIFVITVGVALGMFLGTTLIETYRDLVTNHPDHALVVFITVYIGVAVTMLYFAFTRNWLGRTIDFLGSYAN